MLLLIQLVRPRHWIKNFAVLLPLLTAMKFYDVEAISRISMAFIAFCCCSSVVYIINDIHDRKTDLLFIHTRNRPLASGKISIIAALCLAAGLGVVTFIIGFLATQGVLLFITLYFALQIAYTWYFKQIALLDVICIATGFVLRAATGAIAIKVPLSPWLFICMFTLCLFMGFCKRYMERMCLERSTDAGPNHRPILIAYQQELLIHLITVSASIAVLSFLMYSISPSTVDHYGTFYLVYTLPINIYCVFRFAMLSLQATYASPVDILLKDHALQAAAGLFLGAVCIIIVWGDSLQEYIHSVFA
jgi:4-hydroxybenzoate polyprenyltransferase